jgi:hypothetical protein
MVVFSSSQHREKLVDHFNLHLVSFLDLLESEVLTKLFRDPPNMNIVYLPLQESHNVLELCQHSSKRQSFQTW